MIVQALGWIFLALIGIWTAARLVAEARYRLRRRRERLAADNFMRRFVAGLGREEEGK